MFPLLYTALGFLVFYSGGMVLGWIVLPLVRLFSWHPATGRYRCQRITASGFKLFVWGLSLVPYSTGFFSRSGQRLSSAYFDQPAVVIANHPSLLDIVMITAAVGHGSVVVHKRVYFNPLLGPLARCCGYIWADDSPARGAKVIQEAVRLIGEGRTVIIFPEGSRSDPDKLLKFHLGAFRIAQESGAPIVPLLVLCKPRYLGRGQGFRGYPKRGKVALRVFPFGEAQSAFRVGDARKDGEFWENRYQLALKSLEEEIHDTL